jgi:hypothetical protein
MIGISNFLDEQGESHYHSLTQGFESSVKRFSVLRVIAGTEHADR